MAEVIPLRRVKTIASGHLPARLSAVEKTPPKSSELRASRPPSRIAGRELDQLSGFSLAKFAQRARRHAKLRFFRIFKLFNQLKSARVEPSAYRPVAERLRVARFTRRL